MNNSPNFVKQFPLPPPPVIDSEFELHINKSVPKLWTDDKVIKNKMANKFSLLSINIRSLSKNFLELELWGRPKTMLTRIWPFLTTYLPLVDIF